MANQGKWVVRVVIQGLSEERGQKKYTELLAMIECLRYADIVQVHRNVHDMILFDIRAPHGSSRTSSIEWAKRNAERMSTFEYNAVAAPEWKSDDPRPTGQVS